MFQVEGGEVGDGKAHLILSPHPNITVSQQLPVLVPTTDAHIGGRRIGNDDLRLKSVLLFDQEIFPPAALNIIRALQDPSPHFGGPIPAHIQNRHLSFREGQGFNGHVRPRGGFPNPIEFVRPIGLNVARGEPILRPKVHVAQDRPIGRVLRHRSRIPVSHQHVAVGQDLQRALRHGMDVMGVDVFEDKLGGHGVLVDLDPHASCVRLNQVPVLGAVVEQGDGGVVILPPRIVLIHEAGRSAVAQICEVVSLSPQDPDDFARPAGDVGQGVQISAADEVIPLQILVNGIDVEPVERVRIRDVAHRLGELVMLGCTPLED